MFDKSLSQDVNFPIAAKWKRVLGFVIDIIIFSLVVGVLSILGYLLMLFTGLTLAWIKYGDTAKAATAASITTGISTSIFVLFILALFIVYFITIPIIFERTLGQVLVRVKTIAEQQEKNLLRAYSLRAFFFILFAFALFLPVFLQYIGLFIIIIDGIFTFTNKQNKTLHDILGRTKVVKI